MNRILLFGLLLMNMLYGFSQNIPDQNPNYQKMIVKYSAIVDSFNSLESTTLQRTYKAYDWYEAKMQAKAERQAYRRELRLIEAKNSQYYYNYGYGYPYNNYGYYGYYNYPFYSSSYYPYYNNGYYGNYYRNNWAQSIVPPLVGAAVGTAASMGMYHLLRRR